MAYAVVKYDCQVPNEPNNFDSAKAERGPISVTLSNFQTYTFGPGESHTFTDVLAAECVAQNNSLQIVSRS